MYIDRIINEAKKDIKTIVLPEYMDERVIEAAKIIVKEHIANIILLGNVNIDGIKCINPSTSELTDKFTNELYELRKEKGMTLEKARELLLNDYMYFACMLLHDNMADGIVSGACHSTANTLRPALQIIKSRKDMDIVSSFIIMEVPNSNYGNNGLFVFSDIALVQDPTSSELASIAYEASKSYEEFIGGIPYVALLSHSTYGSAKHELVDKVVEATHIAREKYPNVFIDGELQLDAALVPEVAKIKAKGSNVAGKANVLIFPNIDAGNIGYKLVQRLANANAYGPITQGMNKPVNDLSRGCSVQDIIGVVAITSLQARSNK